MNDDNSEKKKLKRIKLNEKNQFESTRDNITDI